MTENSDEAAVHQYLGEAVSALARANFVGASDKREEIEDALRNARRVCDAVPGRQSLLTLPLKDAALLLGVVDHLGAQVRTLGLKAAKQGALSPFPEI